MKNVTALQRRLLTIFFALDHALLALCTLGNCLPFEMVSSALWALDQDGKAVGRLLRPVVDFLLRPLGPNHCQNSWQWQRSIYQLKSIT